MKILVLVGGSKLTLIIQWRSVAAVPSGSGSNWAFLIAFPNVYLNDVAGFNGSGGISGAAAGGIGSPSTTGATQLNNGSSSASQITAIIVGW
ncbi:hypothetical protein [Cupriavidus basilensis]|uniref:Putative tail fiber protein gp53-like C-terminal domain-containing protein n=1 Tax=Cupriavidus basilensis TaxID=68895 RepID=A0A643FMG3_9BURK|nr:hypothetical protein [Cupriavidus basilensis]QOT77908.1 hypothetical protein F7R26_007765 [Cupriavidus basilensis]